MKLFYGERLVAKKEHLANNKNLIYREKKLLLLSETDFIKVSLGDKGNLFLWGRIFAIIDDNDTYLPIDLSKGESSKIKKIFNKSNINDIIRTLEGDFVGCWIKKNGDVIVFGDSFNRRDVFYQIIKNEFIASTDLSSIITEGKKSYDQAALANVLTIYGGYAPKKHTIYKNVRRLGVGERLEVINDNITVASLPFIPLRTGDFDCDDLEKYVTLLEDAVKIRGSKEGCNWLYLSSGYDSTALLALLVRNFDSSHVKAVTGKMQYSTEGKDANRFEIKRAKKIADYYSVDIEIVPQNYITKDGVKHWEKIKPFLRANHIYTDNACNTYFLSEYVSEKAAANDAIFCGEISDGAHNLGFAQFTTILEHPVQDFREYSDKMASYLFGPTFLKSIVDGNYKKDAVYNLLRSRMSDYTFEEDDNFNEYERKSKLISSFFIRNRRIPFYSLKNEKSLLDAGAESYNSEMFDTYLKECVDNLEPDTIYSWILHLYNTFHWQGSSVKSFPALAQYNNLNLSMPFWDVRIQRFLSEMPENWGRGLELKPTKYPLKWMLENKIDYPRHLQVGPHSYQYDIDANFSFEAEMLYRSALRPYFQKTLEGYPFEKILDSNYFNIDYYRKITDNYFNDVEVSGQEMSALYSLVWLCWIGWY